MISSHNIEWTLNDRLFDCDLNNNSKYTWRLSIVDDRKISFKESILKACSLIADESEKCNKEIGLALSGGLDSQFIALAFKKLNISIICYILAFENNINYEDVKSAKEFCITNNIRYKLITLDIISFMSTGEALEIGRLYGTRSPQFAAHLKLATFMKDTYIVFGGGDCQNLSFNKINNKLYDKISSTSTALHRLCITNNICGADAFYRFIPDIKYSLFRDPLFKCWENQILSLPENMRKFKYFKYIIYESIFPNELKGRKKLTGFEYIDNYDKDFIRPTFNKIPIWSHTLYKDEELNFYYEKTPYIAFNLD